MNEDKEWFFSQIFSDLLNKNVDIDTYIEQVIKQKKIGWDHQDFNDIKKSQQEQDDYILKPFEAEEGVVQCHKCKSYKVFSVAVQTRAADEPMTTMAQCTICKSEWSYNN